MSNDIALPEDSAWAVLAKASTPDERYAAAQYAITPWRFAPNGKPIPKLAEDLPWATDSAETVESILVNLLASEDITKATADSDLRNAKDIAGQPVVIFDLRMRIGDAEGEGWGCYASLDLSVGLGPHEVVNTSAKQVLSVLWRCWCEGRFPVAGVFTLLGTPGKGRSQPIGFQVEDRF
jgi:hypothetical protein